MQKKVMFVEVKVTDESASVWSLQAKPPVLAGLSYHETNVQKDAQIEKLLPG